MDFGMLEKFRNSVDMASLSFVGGVLSSIASSVSNGEYSLFPGFVDVHVHLREPGFSYKETIETGSAAAAHGGYTTVFSMPNLKPVPDSFENLKVQLDRIEDTAKIEVIPYGSITKGQMGDELSDMENMAPFVAGFSDDGRGVQSDDVMREAMKRAKALGKIIVAHCEVNELLKGGYIHDGKWCAEHGHRGICSESEWAQIKRDLELVRETGCSYHVCHISAKESVELIRQAKREGLDVTCETGPHYLLLDDSYMQEDARFKMNPPLRDKTDREALIEGILDGTIDMIATDHAPHSAEEKSRGLEKSLMGIVGIETAFPLLYTYFVKNGIITEEKLANLLCFAPSKRFNIPVRENSFSVWDLNKEYEIDPDTFLSMGRSTPFEGYRVNGECIATVSKGKLAYVK